MDAMREYTKNPLIVVIVGFVVGAIFGLVVLGWGLWPVQWTNATPEHLSAEWQAEYLRASIESFSLNRDAAQALARFKGLGAAAEKTMAAVEQDLQGLSPALITDFQNAVGVTAAAPTSPETTAVPGKEQSKSMLPVLLVALCVLFLVLAGFLAYMFLFRKRLVQSGPPTPAMQAEIARSQAGYTDYAATGEETPISQYMASYKLGDDLFDDSFSIDSPSGEFLGECGVSISETIGVGDHKKVTAFEVWLFDKNDIQTVTKVLMSAHAYNDQAIRQRLEAKGEPILLEPGIETVLETQTLQLVARTVDMSYGNGAMPDESYFNHLLLELAIWSK
ncbi:MAG: hypothetical protein B6D39_09925 [Anaerolineae bacterium UTCFX2]|jgi:hypothetical protein|nr:hypothetical protein [Anaerolineales bacterium]OQY89276.1 MAG: hypothetical protein B6D39_09925 [Anaerolineae bacterium UTCFX2]